MRSHPDRAAATLANVAAAAVTLGDGPLGNGPLGDGPLGDGTWERPGAGAADCRIDLKLLQWRALAAMGRSAAARGRLQAFDPQLRPDLWAGTVQDGVARGFAVALEEAIALAPPPPLPPPLPDDPTRVQVFTGPALRKKKDLLVAGGGARIRFSRKEGVLFVDRDAAINSVNCVRFEARADRGTLDGFAADEAERPRLFSAQFLRPVRYVAGAGHAELQLAGRLGRTAAGFDCSVVFAGDEREPGVRMTVRVDNRHRDHRLRVRFLGLPLAAVQHCCTDVCEQVAGDGRGFLAFTLVRACGRLRVDGGEVATPAAQCLGAVEHEFRLGPGAP